MARSPIKIDLNIKNHYGNDTPNAYEILYAWVNAALGEEPFDVMTFRQTFPSPDPAKVLSDLRRLGYLEFEGRGLYRIVPPDRRLRAWIEKDQGVFGLPGRSPLPHAYCDGTAVTIWTDGGYWTGFTRGFRPLHLRVRGANLAAWRAFLRSAGARATVAGARETLFGVVHVLHPASRVRAVDHRGVRVVPLEEAYAYAAARPYLFEPVLPVLQALLKKDAR